MGQRILMSQVLDSLVYPDYLTHLYKDETERLHQLVKAELCC